MAAVIKQLQYMQKKKTQIVKTFLQKLCKVLVMFHGVVMGDIFLREIF